MSESKFLDIEWSLKSFLKESLKYNLDLFKPWINAGPTSTTLGQRWSTVWTSPVDPGFFHLVNQKSMYESLLQYVHYIIGL